jgi:phage shock protein A
MSEGLGARVKRIIAGAFHAVVDSAEQLAPEVVLEQTLRELEGVLEEVRLELGKELANKHLATKRLADENRKHEELEAQLALALREQRDDLAEAVVSKQLDIEAQIPLLESSIIECSEQQKELEGFVAALTGRHREMLEELRAFRESRAQMSSGTSSTSRGDVSGARLQNTIDRVSNSFNRTMERATGLVRAEGHSSVDTEQKLRELEKLSRDNRIKERLAAAQARLGNKK